MDFDNDFYTNPEFLISRSSVYGDAVIRLARVLLDKQIFFVWSGASKPFQHHYGKGGLARHTVEVINLCQLVMEMYYKKHEVDGATLFLAALYHDAGKLYDYAPMDNTYAEWESTGHKRNIHHISRSAVMWTQACERSKVSRYHEPVLHAILAHHGSRQFGSPVAPKSRVAWLVHHCDSISARMDDADTLDTLDIVNREK